MAWSKPFTDEEKEKIRQLKDQLTSQEIADRLGRSRRGVENVLKKIAAEAPYARAWCRPEAGSGESPRDGALADLYANKRRLEDAMDVAGPSSIPRLAREHRETVMQIWALEGEDVGQAEPGDPGELLATISLRPA